MSENQIQLTIEEADRNIARAEALSRLLLNPDFQELIQTAYIKEEPVRLVSLLGDIGGSYRWVPEKDAMSMPPQNFVQMQKNIQDDLHAVGALQSFFRVVYWRAEMAKSAKDDIEAQKNDPILADDSANDGIPEA